MPKDFLALLALALTFSCASDSSGGNGSNGGDGDLEPGYKAGYKACVLGYKPNNELMGCMRLKDDSDYPEKVCSSTGDYLTKSCPSGQEKICPIEAQKRGMAAFDLEILLYGEYGQLWTCEWLEEFINNNYF